LARDESLARATSPMTSGCSSRVGGEVRQQMGPGADRVVARGIQGIREAAGMIVVAGDH
jgi:hypothetical protein